MILFRTSTSCAGCKTQFLKCTRNISKNSFCEILRVQAELRHYYYTTTTLQLQESKACFFSCPTTVFLTTHL